MRRRIIGWLVVLGIVITGCGGTGTAETTTGQSTDASAATTKASTTTTVAPTTSEPPPLVFESVSFDGDLPRSVAYKGLEWTVSGVTVSNQDLSSIAQPGEPGDDYSIRFDLSVSSPLAEALVKFDLEDMFRLSLGGSALFDPIADVETDLRPHDSAGPGETGMITVHFAAPDASVDLSEAALVIGETDHRPVMVPLTGAIPDSGYPIELDLSSTHEIVLEAGCFTDPATLEIVGGRLTLDITVDEDDVLNEDPETGEVSSVPRRAPVGSRFVELDLRVGTESAGACGGSIVGGDDFLIEVGGELRSHDWDPGIYASEALKSGEFIEFGVGYTIPADLDVLVLLAGYRSGDPVRIEIPIPAEG